MANGHFLGGMADGMEGRRRSSLEERALGIKEKSLAAAEEQDLLARVDKNIAGTMKIVSDTITASKESGANQQQIERAIQPLLADITDIATRSGKDPSAYANQVKAMLSVPVKAGGAAKPQSELAKLEADRRAGFVSDADYTAKKELILKGDKGPSTVEGIRQKIATGQNLSPGEQTVYNDALNSDPLARLLTSLAGGAPAPTNAPAPRPSPTGAQPQSFATPQEIEAAVKAGKVKIGDTVTLNGKKVRVDP